MTVGMSDESGQKNSLECDTVQSSLPGSWNRVCSTWQYVRPVQYYNTLQDRVVLKDFITVLCVLLRPYKVTSPWCDVVPYCLVVFESLFQSRTGCSDLSLNTKICCFFCRFPLYNCNHAWCSLSKSIEPWEHTWRTWPLNWHTVLHCSCLPGNLE